MFAMQLEPICKSLLIHVLIYWSSMNQFKYENSTLSTSKALYIKPTSVCFSDKVGYIGMDWYAFLSL